METFTKSYKIVSNISKGLVIWYVCYQKIYKIIPELQKASWGLREWWCGSPDETCSHWGWSCSASSSRRGCSRRRPRSTGFEPATPSILFFGLTRCNRLFQWNRDKCQPNRCVWKEGMRVCKYKKLHEIAFSFNKL